MFKRFNNVFSLYINKERFNENFFISIARLAQTSLKILFDIKWATNNNIGNFHVIKNKNVIVLESYNNLEATSFLIQNLSNVAIIAKKRSSYTQEFNNIFYLEDIYVSKFSIKKLIYAFYLFFNKSYGTKNLRLIPHYFDAPEFCDNLIYNNKPKSLHFSNDHNPFARSLMMAAKKHNVKSFYYQHASVTNFFPPLLVNEAFLWGQYSENIYQNKSGEKVSVYLSGFNKADNYKKIINSKSKNKTIGIAHNKLDKIEKIHQLIAFLLQNLPEYKCIVRPHPADNRQVKEQNGVSISLAKNEGSLEYLSRIDYLVCGNSSILLEAAIMNVLPVQYTGHQNNKGYLNDYYGFIEQGVAEPAKDFEEILDVIKHHKDKSENFRKRAKFYDASIGSAHEFNVEEYILNVLKKDFNIS